MKWFKGSLVAATIAAGLTLLAWPHPAISVQDGGVHGKVSFGKNAPAAGVVVYIEGVKGRTQRSTATIAQKNKQFTPGLTVVPKGSTVDFPNNDKIFHNVFSVSRTARFDLGLYKSGSSKSVKMRRAGEVDVYCNIHPKMIAKIKVVDSNYYAVTGRDGTFRIDGVPAGTYTIIAWQPHGTQAKSQVTIGQGSKTRRDFSLRKGKKPRHHMRKDGTPYGRYQ